MVARATAGSIERSVLPGQLPRWVARGLISPEQAERILAEEQPAGRPVARGSAEALGYVGGVLILIGAVAIAERYWSDIGASRCAG